MKNNVLILTGAGLTAGPDFFKISTAKLTKDFISYNHPDLYDEQDFIKFLYEEFCLSNNLNKTDIEKNLTQINFETILQMLEEIFSYTEDVERTHHSAKDQNSVKNSVFSLKERLIHKIHKVRNPVSGRMFYLFIELLYNHLIDEITRQIAPFNKQSDNKGMISFSSFLDSSLDSNYYSKRTYSLNYDSWMADFRGYYDGFKNKTFDSTEVINNRSVDCHFNLHGCILWDVFGVIKKLENPEEQKHSQSFDGYSISREAILPSPIISGYNKLTRINSSPFLEIFHSFTSDCFTTNKVLIVGYSFSDPHINSNLTFINKDARIIIVLYYPVESLKDYKNHIHRVISAVTDIFGDRFTDYHQTEILDYTINSDNKRISIFINGIGQSFYNKFPHL